MTALFEPSYDARLNLKHENIMPNKIHEFLDAHGVTAISVFELIDFANHGNVASFRDNTSHRIYELIVVVGLGPRYYFVESYTLS